MAAVTKAKHASRKQGMEEGESAKSNGYLVASQAWMKRSQTGQDRTRQGKTGRKELRNRDSRPRKDVRSEGGGTGVATGQSNTN